MFVVRVDGVRVNDDELLSLRLWEAGTLGITEGDGYVDAFFEDAKTASLFGVPQAVIDVDWVTRTKEAFPPLLVGEKFFVAAPWRTEPTPPGRMRLVINPGTQCGTGYHRCTQLCLEAMEKLITITFNYFVATPEVISLLNTENLHRARHISHSSAGILWNRS